MSGRQRLTFAGIAAVIAVVAIVILLAGGGSDSDDTATNTATPTPEVTQAPTITGTGEETGGASADATATATATAQAEAKPQPVQIVVKGGEPVGGITKIKVNQGDKLAFSVKSDVADEVHVHGFDLMKDVEAGGTVSFSFPAKITGVFEVELEDAKVQLASLTVEP
jgi:nitrous oxide reductase